MDVTNEGRQVTIVCNEDEAHDILAIYATFLTAPKVDVNIQRRTQKYYHKLFLILKQIAEKRRINTLA